MLELLLPALVLLRLNGNFLEFDDRWLEPEVKHSLPPFSHDNVHRLRLKADDGHVQPVRAHGYPFEAVAPVVPRDRTDHRFGNENVRSGHRRLSAVIDHGAGKV